MKGLIHLMRRLLALLVIAFASLPGQGQTWQAISQTGTVKPSYTAWTNVMYDFSAKTLAVTLDDPGGNSGIYADAVWGFNPTTGAWTELWVSDAPNTLCPGDSATRPNHRHTYDQITFDTFRNQTYITSGSCGGALDYDMYAFTSKGTAGSGAWTHFANATTNPNNRQEAAMVYMPNVDRVLLYGGFSNSSTSSDTWEFNPATNTWTQICSSCLPGLRHGHIMAYDPPSGKVILFGGQRSFGGANIAATMIYDPNAPVASRWSAANPTAEAPPAVYGCFGYDKQRGRLLMYPATGPIYAYTTASNTWTPFNIPGGPDPNGGGQGTQTSFCGYDYDHDYFVFFGYPGPNGGPPTSWAINFGNPPGTGTPPSALITAPTNGSTVSGTVTVSASITSSVSIVGVQFQLDGANLGAQDTTAPYSVSWNTTTATNGIHTLSAIAQDVNGTKFASGSVSVTVSNTVPDTTPPTVSISSPTGASTVTGRITVSANASDNVGVAGVQFQLDGANLGAEDTASPYSVSWDTTTASNGSHTVSAIARDAAGNKSTASVTVTVSNSPPPATTAGVGVDATTRYVIETKELAPLVTCTTCFQAATDLIPGQTLELRVRPGTNPAVADQVILKQGSIDGTVASVSGSTFVLQPATGTVWPASVTVVTGNVTLFTGFANSSGPVAVGQKVSVRGLLMKANPSGAQLIASSVQLRQ